MRGHVLRLLEYTLFQYETAKVVQIKSCMIGSVYRALQFTIIAFVLGWIFWKNKGYQDFDDVVSGITTKVKGVQFTNFSGSSIGERIWDVADYVVPPLENGAFFITTNAVVTRDQQQGACDEDPAVAPCLSDADCPAGKPQMLGNGVNTGRCVDSSQRPSSKACEILAWCPVEVDRLPTRTTMFPDAVNFTVLIKNSIEFPMFGVKRRNIQELHNSSHLNSCRYNPQSDPLCPTFRVGDILSMAGVENFTEIGCEGGVVSIHITWNCNLDQSAANCNPTYSFRRLDARDAKVARGWNFRHAHYYQYNGTEHRTLVKAYGIRFIVFVTGQAGKFSIVPLAKNLGSSLALLCIATIVCDLVLICATPVAKRKAYRSAKYEILLDDDSFRTSADSSAPTDVESLMPAAERELLDAASPGYGALRS